MPIQLFESENHASNYALARPSPPKLLIDSIVKYLQSGFPPSKNGTWTQAVDVGAGSGQTTFLIKDYFDQILGIDISTAQIAEANKRNTYPNISFKVSRAESISLRDESVSLVTASQCLHWFDLKAFYNEVNRLLVPGGVFAAFGYLVYPIISIENCSVDNKLAQIIKKAYIDLEEMGYWEQPAMTFLHSNYVDLKLPFAECSRITGIKCPVIYSGQKCIDYIKSWSAYNSFIKSNPEKAKLFIEDSVNQMKNILNREDIYSIQINLTFEFFLLMSRK